MIEHVIFFQPRTSAGRNYMNSFGAEQTWTPWFALTLAPIAERLGFTVELVDARVNPDWAARIELLSSNELLAVTVMTGNAIRDAVEASTIARENGAKVIWGGPHVSLFPDETAKEAPVDAVVPGFGYKPFGRILKQIQMSTWPDEPIVTASCADDLIPIDNRLQKRSETFHSVNLDLVTDWHRYLNADIAIADRTVNLITSEGCTRRCTYCSEPKTSGGEWLTADVRMLVDVAKGVQHRSGANGFKLHDPNFFDNLARATAWATEFSTRLSLPWAATMHPADLSKFTDEEICRFAESGLSRVLVGLESPDPKLVKLAGKQYDPKAIPSLARKLANARVRGMFSFIVGWPDADPDHYERTVECAKGIREIWPEHQAKIHFLEPWPGTPMYRLLLRRGFEAPRSLAEWVDVDYYQARYSGLHDPQKVDLIRKSNRELSPYVDA